MRNFMFGQEYYLTNYDEINEYLNFIINDDKDKQIKYIFSNEVLSWRDTNHGKRYEISPEFFIVFDNDAVLKINYNFYSLMYIEYMWIQNLNINDNGTANASWIREWAVTWLNEEEGDEANGMIPFNAQRFNEFSLAYHHDLMDRAGLWGFRDIDGKIIVEPKYLFKPIEVNGLYILCIGSGWEESSEWTEG